MPKADQPRSSDAIAVFEAYVALINAKRGTVWARHNALLVANSLIISALAISPAALWENKWASLAAFLGLGLLISGAWLLITIKGWAVMKHHGEIAGSFAAACFKPLPIPSPRPSTPKRRCGFIESSCS